MSGRLAENSEIQENLGELEKTAHQSPDVHDHDLQCVPLVLHGQLDLPLDAAIGRVGGAHHRRLCVDEERNIQFKDIRLYVTPHVISRDIAHFTLLRY